MVYNINTDYFQIIEYLVTGSPSNVTRQYAHHWLFVLIIGQTATVNILIRKLRIIFIQSILNTNKKYRNY